MEVFREAVWAVLDGSVMFSRTPFAFCSAILGVSAVSSGSQLAIVAEASHPYVIACQLGSKGVVGWG